MSIFVYENKGGYHSLSTNHRLPNGQILDIMTIQNATKGSFIGLYDINHKPIHEGDVVRFRNFRSIVIYNEFFGHWTMVYVGVYNDMDRNPHCRSMYLENEASGLTDELVRFWNIQVTDNIYKNPVQLSDDSMLA